jgi:hypothetical protein
MNAVEIAERHGITVEQAQDITFVEDARIANEQAHREWEDAEAEYVRSIR